MSKSTHCYIATWKNQLVGFLSVIFRTGTITYWAESRLVILPEFQGLGIGSKLSESIGEEYTKKGYRYFSKTAHKALGEHRNNSNKWRSTVNNMKDRLDYINKDGTHTKTSNRYGVKKETAFRDAFRVCYSHEFINNIDIDIEDLSSEWE